MSKLLFIVRHCDVWPAPGEIADVVAFVAGDGASYINGSNILVDGGWTAYGGW